MENILKLVLGFTIIIFAGYLIYQIFVQATSDTYLRLTSEIAEISAGNDEIAARNDLLRIRINALRADSRAIERKVRDELGMARPDEVIIMFKKKKIIPTEPEEEE